jgi:hypothetical protein
MRFFLNYNPPIYAFWATVFFCVSGCTKEKALFFILPRHGTDIRAYDWNRHQVPWALSQGVMGPGHEADHLQLVPRSRIRGSIHPLPIRLHGVVLN